MGFVLKLYGGLVGGGLALYFLASLWSWIWAGVSEYWLLLLIIYTAATGAKALFGLLFRS